MGSFWDNLVAVAFPLGLLYFFSFLPLRRVWRARGWRQTPCVILGSAVEEDHIEPAVYRILIRYQYEVGGRIYRGSRYDFSIGATAGFRWKKKKVDQLAPGTRAVCYVDPADPGDAVIERGVTWDMVFVGVFAATCLVVLGVFFIETGL